MSIPAVGGYADQWHRYYWQGAGPMPGVTSVLKIQDALIGGDLAAWGGRIAADYLLNEWARPATNEIDMQWNETSLRSGALAAVSAKRDIGSAVHGKIEDLLSGKVWTRTEATGLYLDGFSLFMAEHHPEFLLTEQMVFSPTHNYGGRFDFIAKIAGKVALCDVKTGSLKASHRLQLAAYAAADFMGKPDDAREYDLPTIRAFYILLLREGSYELVEQRVGRLERRHFARLAKTYNEAKRWEKEAA